MFCREQKINYLGRITDLFLSCFWKQCTSRLLTSSTWLWLLFWSANHSSCMLLTGAEHVASVLALWAGNRSNLSTLYLRCSCRMVWVWACFLCFFIVLSGIPKTNFDLNLGQFCATSFAMKAPKYLHFCPHMNDPRGTA